MKRIIFVLVVLALIVLCSAKKATPQKKVVTNPAKIRLARVERKIKSIQVRLNFENKALKHYQTCFNKFDKPSTKPKDRNTLLLRLKRQEKRVERIKRELARLSKKDKRISNRVSRKVKVSKKSSKKVKVSKKHRNVTKATLKMRK
jgi:hypothetical protein